MPLPERPSAFFITIIVQHFSNVPQPDTLVNVVSSGHRAYCIGFRFRYNFMCRTWWFLKRSCNLIIKMVHSYNNHRYHCWEERLMLCKNWALHTLPTIIMVYPLISILMSALVDSCYHKPYTDVQSRVETGSKVLKRMTCWPTDIALLIWKMTQII